VTLLDEDDNIITLSNEAMAFGYRTSIVAQKDYIVLEVKLALEKGNYEDIINNIRILDEKRLAKQPIDKPSAGSTFKRPEGHYAGKLIDDSGLRGVQFGDARVSRKHCGFVVNTGNAKFRDVMTLIQLIKKVVKDNFNVELEREVRILGRD
jgi:UDP-N-acetylmuramate dehydrogenase